MSADEDTELRDLVAQSLESKGVLGKIRAQLRASVFLALEEQDGSESKIPLSNTSLKKFINTTEGRLVTGLVREYLEFFDLDFTIAVFDPESNFSDRYQGRNQLANELKLNDNDAVSSKPLLVEVIRQMTSGSGANNVTTAVKPPPLSLPETQQQVKNASAISSPRQNGPVSPRSTSPSSGKVEEEDNTKLMISAGFESDDEMKPSRIPQRIKDDKSSKSEGSHSSDNGGMSDHREKSLSESHKERSGRGSPDRTLGSDDDDFFAEFSRKPKSTLLDSTAKQTEAEKRGALNPDAAPKPQGMLSSLKGAPSLSGGGLGSLKGAPPLPGASTTKDIPKSPDWNDLAEIDSRINKLGFDIPDEKSNNSQDYNDDYDDDFQPTSSHISDQSLSITEDIEEQLSSYRSNSNIDDLLTTDRTVSRASDSGLDYAEDILDDF